MVLACIPNVQHWTILRALLAGSWRYEDEGLLDRTHLRFFTLEGIQHLLAAAGLVAIDVRVREATGLPGEAFGDFQKLMGPVVQSLGLDRERFAAKTAAVQYVVRAGRREVPMRRVLIQTLRAVREASEVRVDEPNAFCATLPGVRAVTYDDEHVDPAAAFADEEKVLILQRRLARCLCRGRGREAVGPARLSDRRRDGRRPAPLAPLRRPAVLHVPGLPRDPDLYRAPGRLPSPVQPERRRLSERGRVTAAVPDDHPDGPVTLFFGALNRADDWQPIMPALNRVLGDFRVASACRWSTTAGFSTPCRPTTRRSSRGVLTSATTNCCTAATSPCCR